MAQSSRLPRFTAGKLVMVPADVWNKVMERIEMITPIAGRNVQIDDGVNGSRINAVFPGYVAQPFELTLVRGEVDGAVTYKVTVGPGLVNERIPGTDPALANHYPSNIGGFDEDRVEFDISPGQQISIVVLVKENGRIGHDSQPPVTVTIEDEDAESVHYIPPCADDATGTPGAYHYKLGVLRPGDTSADAPHLERWLSGDHIEHFQDITRLENTTNPTAPGVGRVLKEFNAETWRYLLRSIIKGDGQLRIDENADDITIRGNGKSGSLVFVDCSEEMAETGRIEWTDGLITTEGEVVIQAGCDGTGGGTSAS